MVGDHATDLQAAQAANVKTLVLVGEHIPSEHKLMPQALVYENMPQFVAALKNQSISL